LQSLLDGLIFPLLKNFALMAVCASAGLAQLLKLYIYWIKDKELNFWHLFEAGGMPSSHSAAVTSLTLGVLLTQGVGSPLFAAAVVFSMIVMYDATGVRRAAGKQALVLNKIIDDMYPNEKNQKEKLREILGHDPIEVIAGVVLAVVITFLTYYVYPYK
jgi:acid phosphatase family membrane protein YuiD